MKKRIICGALIAALSLGAAAGAQAGLFRDVPDSHWAAGYIEEAAARGYVRGVGDGLYRPGQEVTYAEFAAMITRVLFPREQEKYEEGLRPWYAAYISICTVHGVFAGTAYQPGLRENEPMTRAAGGAGGGGRAGYRPVPQAGAGHKGGVRPGGHERQRRHRQI